MLSMGHQRHGPSVHYRNETKKTNMWSRTRRLTNITDKNNILIFFAIVTLYYKHYEGWNEKNQTCEVGQDDWQTSLIKNNILIF